LVPLCLGRGARGDSLTHEDDREGVPELLRCASVAYKTLLPNSLTDRGMSLRLARYSAGRMPSAECGAWRL
jgi:hypothetical protein